MPINAGDDESEDDFMARCMHHFKHDSSRDYGHEQSIAACLNIYRKGGGKKAIMDQSLRKALAEPALVVLLPDDPK